MTRGNHRESGNYIARELQGTIRENVKMGAWMYTDQFISYRGLEGRYRHLTVNHADGEYARDRFIHVNSIENAWSHFKRQVYGIHHWISAKHTDRYLDEFVWRYNLRGMEEGARVNAFLGRLSGRLTYAELIG